MDILKSLRMRQAAEDSISQSLDVDYPNNIYGKAADEIESLRNQLSTNTPDGWKLVPIEPNDEMYLAGQKVESAGYSCLRIYEAMIKASPTHKER